MRLTEIPRLPGVYVADFAAIVAFSLSDGPLYIDPPVIVSDVSITEAEYHQTSNFGGDFRVTLPALPPLASAWYRFAARAVFLRADTPSGLLDTPLTFCDVGAFLWLRDETGADHLLDKSSYAADDGDGRPSKTFTARGAYTVTRTRGLSVSPDPPGIRIVDGDLIRR